MNAKYKKVTSYFFLIAVGWSWPIMLAVDAWFGPYFFEQGNIFLARITVLLGHAIAMLGPAVASIIIWNSRLKDHKPRWEWGAFKFYILALVFFASIWALPGVVGIFLNNFQFAKEIPSYMYYYMHIYGAVIWFAGMGEEIGWCAFLLGYLPKYIGKTRSIIVSGALRGLWHLPVLIGTPIYQLINGKGSITVLLVSIIVFVIQLMLSNIFFGAAFAYFWDRTRSIPLVGWAHAMTDLARDFLSIFIVGYLSNTTYVMIAQLPIFLIGSIYLLNSSKKEGITSFKILISGIGESKN